MRAERLPKITVHRLAGSDSSVVDTNERTGVIPEPGGDGGIVVLRLGIRGDGELAHRGHHVEHVAGPQLFHRPGGEGATAESLDAHAKPRRVGVGADRVGAAHVVAIDHGPQRDVLAGEVAEAVGQRLGHIEGDRNRVVGERGYLGYTQQGESGASQLTAP